MNGHRTAEQRSLVYHREIARRLAAEPRVLETARRRVAAWRASGEVHARWVDGWSRLLSLPIDDLARALVDSGEEMIALRQATPFAGVLDARDRWALWRSVEHEPGAA